MNRTILVVVTLVLITTPIAHLEAQDEGWRDLRWTMDYLTQWADDWRTSAEKRANSAETRLLRRELAALAGELSDLKRQKQELLRYVDQWDVEGAEAALERSERSISNVIERFEKNKDLFLGVGLSEGGAVVADRLQQMLGTPGTFLRETRQSLTRGARYHGDASHHTIDGRHAVESLEEAWCSVLRLTATLDGAGKRPTLPEACEPS
jgi:hypothetical protein